MSENQNQIPVPDPLWLPPYTVLRANAYPSIKDQLDTLYHGGFEAWKASIDAVKEMYPKPETSE
jgi:hypothetical protein